MIHDISNETLMTVNNELKNEQIGHRSRLRKRMISGNHKGLLDYELLELLLFTSHTRIDVKPIAKRLINSLGGFTKVFYSTIEELQAVEGVGESSIASIFCIKEIMERILREDLKKSIIINSWKKLIDYLKISIGNCRIENIHVLYLNKKNCLIIDDIQNFGTIDQTPVYIREIVKKALLLGATSIILAHNHPSGDPEPSETDVLITKQLLRTCMGVNITLLDHVIVTPHTYYSFKSHGLL